MIDKVYDDPNFELIHLVPKSFDGSLYPKENIDKTHCGLIYSWGKGKYWKSWTPVTSQLENAHNAYICIECARKELEIRRSNK